MYPEWLLSVRSRSSLAGEETGSLLCPAVSRGRMRLKYALRGDDEMMRTTPVSITNRSEDPPENHCSRRCTRKLFPRGGKKRGRVLCVLLLLLVVWERSRSTNKPPRPHDRDLGCSQVTKRSGERDGSTPIIHAQLVIHVLGMHLDRCRCAPPWNG
jgi:hypothetical protein